MIILLRFVKQINQGLIMSTMAVTTRDSTVSFTSKTEEAGKLMAREVKRHIPAAHDALDKLKLAGIIAGIIFVASIVMWAVGASTGVVGLEIAGKIIFGLSISVLALGIIGTCVVGGCVASRA